MQDLGLIVGSKRNDGGYSLSTNFGIEQWEEGKLTTHRRQQWWLSCHYPEPLTKRPETWCSLDRIVIDQPLTPDGGSIVFTYKHFTSDDTLKILRADWSTGILDFTIVLHDKTTIEVMARLAIRKDMIYLNSFKATAIARGLWSDSMSTIDFKIPKYDYKLNVPVEMRGFKSASDKEWDDMLATLSKQDQHLWQDFRPKLFTSCVQSDKLAGEEFLRNTIPDYGTRKMQIEKGQSLTAEEQALIERKISLILADEVERCLSGSKISNDGQKKIIGVFRKQLTTKNQ